MNDFLANEAVDEQIKSKLTRLNKISKEHERIEKEMKSERLNKLNEINNRMGHSEYTEVKPFLPYDNAEEVGMRQRSRGLTYEEATELQKYQKSIGAPIHPSKCDYPSITEYEKPLGKPIGKPPANPVFPIPGHMGQGHGYPSLPTPGKVPSYSSGSQTTRNVPPPQPQPVAPGAQKRGSGFKKLFGFGS